MKRLLFGMLVLGFAFILIGFVSANLTDPHAPITTPGDSTDDPCQIAAQTCTNPIGGTQYYCCATSGGAHLYICMGTPSTWNFGKHCKSGQICSVAGVGGRCKNPQASVDGTRDMRTICDADARFCRMQPDISRL